MLIPGCSSICVYWEWQSGERANADGEYENVPCVDGSEGHDFPEKQDFCTHLGHEKFGAHARNYICRKCGALKSVYLSGPDKGHIFPAADAIRFIHYWTCIHEPHRCMAGWRGATAVDVSSSDLL